MQALGPCRREQPDCKRHCLPYGWRERRLTTSVVGGLGYAAARHHWRQGLPSRHQDALARRGLQAGRHLGEEPAHTLPHAGQHLLLHGGRDWQGCLYGRHLVHQRYVVRAHVWHCRDLADDPGEGCGRFFEGTPAEMDEALNKRLAALPDDTVTYVSFVGAEAYSEHSDATAAAWTRVHEERCQVRQVGSAERVGAEAAGICREQPGHDGQVYYRR